MARPSHLKRTVDMQIIADWVEPGARVLDLGCGRGVLLEYLVQTKNVHAVGVDLDADIVGHLAEKKGSDLILWDSTQRAAKHALGSPDGSQGMIDALHHAANQARTRTLDAGRELLEKAGVVQDPGFAAALLAVLEVLPVSRAFGAPDVLAASSEPPELAGRARPATATPARRRAM